MEVAGAACGWGTPSTRKNTRKRREARRPQTFHHSHTMELTTDQKLDRLEAALAEIGNRLDALEAAQREGLAQWEADRARWAAEPLAGDVARWPAQGEAADEDEAAGKLGPAAVAARFLRGEPMRRLNYANTRGVLTLAAAALGAVADEEDEWAQEEAADDDEDRAFSEALKRLDMTFLNSAHPGACPKP